MTEVWVAVSYGALDMRGWGEPSPDAEIMLLPVHPIDEPIGLRGEPAELWRRLIDGPVNDTDLSESERELVHEYEVVGLASREPNHPARITTLSRPWLSSPLHELVYSLVANVARENCIEAVFIKGPMLQRQGLRKREHSGDVDVWVDPTHILRLSKSIQEWGWSEHQGLWTGIPTAHSITVQPRFWGCEIDIHRYFPGFSMKELPLFILVSQQTESVVFAGTVVNVPEKGVHAIVQALHLARPTGPEENAQHPLSQAVESLVAGGTSAHQFAVEARALAALSTVAKRAWPDLSYQVAYAAPKNWTWRTHATTAGKLKSAFSTVPWRYRALYIRRLFWPGAAEISRADLRAGYTGDSGLRAQFRRIMRSFKASG